MRLGLVTVLLLVTTACADGGTPRPAASPSAAPATSATASVTPAPTRSAVPGAPKVMASMGDSITRAFLDCPQLGDCPPASWSTGTDADIESHLARLGGGVEAHNVAVSGARVAGLQSQAQQAVGVKAEYVTILIGANDACRGSESAMTPVAEYTAAFDRAMTTLTRGLPDAKILVASIPSLMRLWEVGKDDPKVRGTWDRFGICQSILAASADDARRARVNDRVAAYNAAMAASCARHANCRWDGGAVFEYEFTLAEVNPIDYWHPSRLGQRARAEVTWTVGFWG